MAKPTRPYGDVFEYDHTPLRPGEQAAVPCSQNLTPWTPTVATPNEEQWILHGIDTAHWDNLGGGWQIICLCGWGTACNERMADTGQDFDDHIKETKEGKK